MKSILGIINQPPTGSSISHEAIEMLMVYAAFGFEVTILLRGSAVLNLQQNQQPEVVNLKNHSALFAALDLYEIKQLLVDENAFYEYQCKISENIHYQLISEQDMVETIAAHTEVINF